jgi:hypothetical protein
MSFTTWPSLQSVYTTHLPWLNGWRTCVRPCQKQQQAPDGGKHGRLILLSLWLQFFAAAGMGRKLHGSALLSRLGNGHGCSRAGSSLPKPALCHSRQSGQCKQTIMESCGFQRNHRITVGTNNRRLLADWDMGLARVVALACILGPS